MFKHLLLPTDGSPSADAAVLQGLRLARSMGARATAVHVIPQFHVLTYRVDMLKDTREEFLADSRQRGEQCLAALAKAAREEGVPFETLLETSDHPHDAIVAAAERLGCDLIVMASRGLHGGRLALLGSETTKVLMHGSTPVLVYR
ncbi:MAG TPA: universal stress protein [Albitalea sp.]|nr:universal stress protein [Albitalea sp.]